MKKKVLFLVNLDSFFVSHRFRIAENLIKEGCEVHIATEFTGFKKILTNRGLKTHSIKFKRNSSSLFVNMFAIIQIFFLLKKIKPDLLHLISIKPIILGGLVSLFSPVKSLVISVTGLGSMFLSSGFFSNIRIFIINYLYKQIFTFPNLVVILQNKNDQNYLVKNSNLKKSKIKIIKGMGVDLKEFKFSKIKNSTYPTILMASRLIADKGLFEYIKAAEHLKKEKFKGNFLLAGNIDKYNPSKISSSHINLWKKKKIIRHYNYLSEISKLIKKSTIVVLPSYREGFPKILMEASACGRPIIATNVPGCRDAVINKKTGLLIPPKNYIALAKSIKLLCSNKKKIKKMGIRARQHAVKNFDIRNIVSQHLSIYKKFLK